MKVLFSLCLIMQLSLSTTAQAREGLSMDEKTAVTRMESVISRLARQLGTIEFKVQGSDKTYKMDYNDYMENELRRKTLWSKEFSEKYWQRNADNPSIERLRFQSKLVKTSMIAVAGTLGVLGVLSSPTIIGAAFVLPGMGILAIAGTANFDFKSQELDPNFKGWEVAAQLVTINAAYSAALKKELGMSEMSLKDFTEEKVRSIIAAHDDLEVTPILHNQIRRLDESVAKIQ